MHVLIFLFFPRMTFANGSEYAGEWKDNCPHGQGKMVGDSGNYEGDWFLGVR